MRILQPLALLSFLALVAPSALAQYQANPFSYTYLEVDYVMSTYEPFEGWGTLPEPDVDGWGGWFSIEADTDVRLVGGYDDVKGDGNKRRDAFIGLGFVSHVNNRVDGKLDFKYLRTEMRYEDLKDTQSGWGIEGGVRALLTDMIELDLTGEYRDLYEGEFGGHAGLVIHATQNIALAFYYTYFGTQETYRGGLRFSM